MSEKQNADDLIMVKVSSKVLAQCFGISDRRVRQLADDGIIKRDSHGKYLLLESVKNYIINLKIQKAGRRIEDDFDDVLDLNNEKAKHEKLKSMITQIKLLLIQGKVHKSEDVGRVLTSMLTNFKSKLIAMPNRIAPRLERKDKIFIQNLLKNEVDAILNELSEYNPADYYSDEHIEIGDEDVLGIGEVSFDEENE